MGAATVFLSYAREDAKRAKAIARHLKSNGFEPWLDVEKILPGEKWETKIFDALAEADFVVLCLSNRSVSKRGFLQREIRTSLSALEEMLDHDIYLLPVRLDDCEVPTKLRDIQWVDLFEANGLSKLLSALSEGARRRGLQKPRGAKKAPKAPAGVDLSKLGGAEKLEVFSVSSLFNRS
jgi:hypothetical protein